MSLYSLKFHFPSQPRTTTISRIIRLTFKIILNAMNLQSYTLDDFSCHLSILLLEIRKNLTLNDIIVSQHHFISTEVHVRDSANPDKH